MANPSVLLADTKLYCPAEPKGRVFPAGSAWPGDAWSDNPGGKPVGSAAVDQAMKDLIAAQDTIDSLSTQLASKDHDLARLSAERDEANGKVSGLEQRAIDAEAGKDAAEQAAASYMRERDAARADAQRFSDAVDGYRPDAEKVPGLVEQLNAANQAIADLNDQLAAAKPKKAAKAADALAGDGA